MKKRLILAALLSVGVLVGCGNTGSSSEPVSSQPSSSEVSSEVSNEEVSSESSSEEVSSESSSEETTTNWGTESAPLTVAQAIELMKDWTGTEWSEVEGYLTGKVVSISKSSYGDYNAVLESSLTGNESFEIYGAYLNDGVVEPVAGSTVTVKGHFTKYVKSDGSVVKYEVAFSKSNSYRPYIIASDAVATEPEQPSSSENTSSEPNVSTPEGAVTAKKTLADLGWENGTLYSTLELDDVVTATTSGTPVGSYNLNTGKYYNTGKGWRLYQNESPELKISVESGYELVSVKITYTVDKTGVMTLDGSNIDSGAVVPASGTSISFSVGNTGSVTNGQIRVSEIQVIYIAA